MHNNDNQIVSIKQKGRSEGRLSFSICKMWFYFFGDGNRSVRIRRF